MNRGQAMTNFGFKIVDRSRSEIEPLVARTLEEHRPIEVGLYFGDSGALDFLEQQLPSGGLKVAVHLDHMRLSILDLERRKPALREQLTQARRLGAAYVITHLSPYPTPARPELREPLLERICSGLRHAIALSHDHGLGVHIENTYDGPAFYRWLHRSVQARGVDGVHVCFDLGHAKVWSTDHLQGWLGLLCELRDTARGLHFHLHANRGLSDEHLSFIQAERLGITAADGFTGSLDYYQALAEIAERFPAAAKVFEVPAAEAEDNLDHVLNRIAAARRGGDERP
jgi:sugar phosphate isomerase/epimerase